MKKIALVSHGCPKNLVDSELILGMLAQNGYGITLNEDESDIVIVNTCSFICDAERESIRSILELVDKGKKVIVTGCLAQKHPEELKKEIPELAGIIGTADFGAIVDVIKILTKNLSQKSVKNLTTFILKILNASRLPWVQAPILRLQKDAATGAVIV